MGQVTVEVTGTSVPEAEECEYSKWELEEAVRTLMRAEEIKQDPDLMAAIAPNLDLKQKSYKSLAALRKLAGQMAVKEKQEEANGTDEPDEGEP